MLEVEGFVGEGSSGPVARKKSDFKVYVRPKLNCVITIIMHQVIPHRFNLESGHLADGPISEDLHQAFIEVVDINIGSTRKTWD